MLKGFEGGMANNPQKKDKDAVGQVFANGGFCCCKFKRKLIYNPPSFKLNSTVNIAIVSRNVRFRLSHNPNKYSYANTSDVMRD